MVWWHLVSERNIWCHVWPCPCLRLHYHQIRHQATRKAVVAGSHILYLRNLCGYVSANILALSLHPRGLVDVENSWIRVIYTAGDFYVNLQLSIVIVPYVMMDRDTEPTYHEYPTAAVLPHPPSIFHAQHSSPHISCTEACINWMFIFFYSNFNWLLVRNHKNYIVELVIVQLLLIIIIQLYSVWIAMT